MGTLWLKCCAGHLLKSGHASRVAAGRIKSVRKSGQVEAQIDVRKREKSQFRPIFQWKDKGGNVFQS